MTESTASHCRTSVRRPPRPRGVSGTPSIGLPSGRLVDAEPRPAPVRSRVALRRGVNCHCFSMFSWNLRIAADPPNVLPPDHDSHHRNRRRPADRGLPDRARTRSCGLGRAARDYGRHVRGHERRRRAGLPRARRIGRLSRRAVVVYRPRSGRPARAGVPVRDPSPLIFGALYERSGTLTVPAVVHGLTNAVGLIAVYATL